uniref:EpsG family protein n=1 Tax=Halobacillus sp. Marseille-Q1614 TaxID=2709134 RepID=UPI001C2DEA7D
ALLYLTHLSDNVVNILPLNLNFLETYSSQEVMQNYGSSYNINFLLFNTGFLFLFLFAKSTLMLNNTFKSLLNMYILSSGVFFLFGFVAFADRIAGYSWLLIPLLIAVLIKNIKITINKAVLLSFILIIGILTTPLIHAFFVY